MNDKLALQHEQASLKTDSSGAFRPENLAQAMQLADMLANSNFVPQAFKGKPGDVLVAMQMGSEVGLSTMQALQNIAPINGRPSIWGDAVLGLALNDPRCQDVIETFDNETQTATCTVKIRNRTDVVRTFSLEDAKRAGLAGKKGPWQEYRQRMLQMRARGFAIRDAFPDVLRGLTLREEAQDLPAPVEAQAEEIPPPQSKSATARLKARKQQAEEPAQEAEPEPEETLAEESSDDFDPATVAMEAMAYIRAATTMDELEAADWSQVRKLSDELRKQVRDAYAAKKDELGGEG